MARGCSSNSNSTASPLPSPHEGQTPRHYHHPTAREGAINASTSSKRNGLPLRAANRRTLPHKLPGRDFPRFIQDVSDFSRHIFSTDIRPLTGHAFIGEYTPYFRPKSYDPHHCPCGGTPPDGPPRHRWLRVTFVGQTTNLYSLLPSPCLSQLFNTVEGAPRSGTFRRPPRPV